MERILSKEEIAELLAAVRVGEISTDIGGEADFDETRYGEKNVQSLDLFRSTGRERLKIPNLDPIFETFGRNFGISVTNRLRRTVSILFTGTETQMYDPMVTALGEQSAIGVLRVEPFKTAVLLVLDGDMAFAIVELLLGGTPDGKPVSLNRPLTTIETHLISGLMEDSCADLQKAFRPVEMINPTMMKVEKNARMLNIVKADTVILISRFQVRIDKFTSAMNLAIPYPALEPLRDKLNESLLSMDSQGQDDWLTTIYQDVQEVATTVTARLADLTLSARDLLNFQVGDVIGLDRQQDDPIDLLVEGKLKFRALAGVNRGKKAVRIMERI